MIAELIDPAAPAAVRRWAAHLPDWIEVRTVRVGNDDMLHLDPGERAAIAIARSEPGALLLIDETVAGSRPRDAAFETPARSASCVQPPSRTMWTSRRR